MFDSLDAGTKERYWQARSRQIHQLGWHVGCFWEINVSSRKNTEWEEKSTFAALRQNIELQLYERKIQERTKGKCFPILIVFLAGLKEKNEFEAWKFEELCIMVSQSAVSSCMFRCLLRWTKLVRQVLIFFFSLSLSIQFCRSMHKQYQRRSWGGRKRKIEATLWLKGSVDHWMLNFSFIGCGIRVPKAATVGFSGSGSGNLGTCCWVAKLAKNCCVLQIAGCHAPRTRCSVGNWFRERCDMGLYLLCTRCHRSNIVGSVLWIFCTWFPLWFASGIAWRVSVPKLCGLSANLPSSTCKRFTIPESPKNATHLATIFSSCFPKAYPALMWRPRAFGTFFLLYQDQEWTETASGFRTLFLFHLFDAESLALYWWIVCAESLESNPSSQTHQVKPYKLDLVSF